MWQAKKVSRHRKEDLITIFFYAPHCVRVGFIPHSHPTYPTTLTRVLTMTGKPRQCAARWHMERHTVALQPSHCGAGT